MKTRIALLLSAVLVALSSCMPPLSGVVVDRNERNDLPRRVDNSGYKYACGIDWEGEFSCQYKYVIDSYYVNDRSGYVLTVRDDNRRGDFEIEVDLETYKKYREGDRYP